MGIVTSPDGRKPYLDGSKTIISSVAYFEKDKKLQIFFKYLMINRPSLDTCTAIPSLKKLKPSLFDEMYKYKVSNGTQ